MAAPFENGILRNYIVMLRIIAKSMLRAMVGVAITAGYAWAADSIPANQPRDQNECYQSALASAAAARPVDSKAFINWAYYGCMQSRGYVIPSNSAEIQKPSQYANASAQAPVQNDAITVDASAAGFKKEIESLGLMDHELRPLSAD